MHSSRRDAEPPSGGRESGAGAESACENRAGDTQYATSASKTPSALGVTTRRDMQGMQ